MTHIPTSLEADIMDGHYSPDSSEEGVPLENSVKIYRDKCSLPVMGMNDVRSETYERKGGKHGF